MNAKINAIVTSTWSTKNLVLWALNWNRYMESGYCWTVVASTREDAQAYYDELAVDDVEGLRWEAAEALVAGGWDIRKINYKKS